MPALPLFTFTSLVYCYLVWNDSDYLTVLSSHTSLYFGLGSIGFSIVISLLPRIYYGYKYDLFSVGCLIVWFADWSQIFGLEAPIFYVYPVYFAVLSVIITHSVINQRAKFDENQLKLIHIMSDWKPLNPLVLAFATLGSLSLPKHYLLYPIFMTFLYIRYCLTVCVNDVENKRKIP